MKLLLVTLVLPLGVTLLLLGAAVWAGRGPLPKARRGMVLALAALVVLYGASTPFVGRTLSMALAGMVQAREVEPSRAQAIVVLTGGMVNAGPVGWLPSKESYQRLAVGYELQRLLGGRVPVLVSGGYTRGVQAPSEARAAADFFAATRAQITPTELEETSTDTYESAMQLSPVLAKREAHTVFLVTDDVHMLRALATYRARGVDAVPFPALTVLDAAMGVRGLLPSPAGLAMTSDALYEIYGIVAYLISGRIGWGDVFYEN
ncbi:MAG: YdcF family protein [Alphaproteobacteria bacterium]